jgi:hypothetical protein
MFVIALSNHKLSTWSNFNGAGSRHTPCPMAEEKYKFGAWVRLASKYPAATIGVARPCATISPSRTWREMHTTIISSGEYSMPIIFQLSQLSH